MSEVVKLQPRQRIIVACDIEGSTIRTNPVKAAIRADMYDLLEAALLECEITEDLREPFINTGDGVITLVRPVDGLPKTLLVDTFVPVLSEMLAEHGAVHTDRMFRLRVAIHTGEVHFDRQGVFGEDIDIALRLLNAPELKRQLQQTAAPLGLVVSDHIHRSVVRHGYGGIDPQIFQDLIYLNVAGRPFRGWVKTAAASMASVRLVPVAEVIAGQARAAGQAAPQPFVDPSERLIGEAAPTEAFIEEVTGQQQVDRLMRLAGHELDARSRVQSVDLDKLLNRIERTAQRENPHDTQDEVG